jgi:hypothetical protein
MLHTHKKTNTKYPHNIHNNKITFLYLEQGRLFLTFRIAISFRYLETIILTEIEMGENV